MANDRRGVVVFVSHAHDDWDLDVRPIVDRLRSKGVPVWTSHDDIKTKWGMEIVEVLKDHSIDVVVLLFLSETSITRKNVENEIIVASNAGRTIVPVILTAGFELSGPLELHLASCHHIEGFKLPPTILCEEIIARLPATAENPATPSDAPQMRLRFSAADVVVDGRADERRPLRLSTVRRETIEYLIEQLGKRGSADEHERVSKLLGMQLFSSAFPPEARHGLAAIMSAGGRLELCFDSGSGLDTWPWELLHYWEEQAERPSDFLNGSGTSIVRLVGDAPDETTSSEATDMPLRVLAVVPKPGKPLPDLDSFYTLVGARSPNATPANDRLRTLTELTTGQETMSFTDQRVGWKDFATAVGAFRPHVVHIVAVARLDKDREPQLAFADLTGVESQEWVPADRIAGQLKPGLKGSQCLVVALSVLEGEEVPSHSLSVRIGREFAQRVPAVVVHPYRPGEDTDRFLGGLYRRLLSRTLSSLGAADFESILLEGRQDERENSKNRLYGFGEPVVFLNPKWNRKAPVPTDDHGSGYSDTTTGGRK